MKSAWQRTELSLAGIEAHAQQLSQDKLSWHFHILTEKCTLNESCEHALILESPSNEELFVHLCSFKPMDTSKRLVKLLHGQDIVQKVVLGEISDIPPAAVEMISRAKELSANGILWHHHMLFPDCVFNSLKGKWTIVFEDPESKQTLESVTDQEPKQELKEIEALFYQQGA